MDIKQLRYFIAIAEEGSLSAAAQRVNVAQPSLSQHVLSLERELDVKLLERSSRGVSLTQSGEVLLSHAREITNALHNAGTLFASQVANQLRCYCRTSKFNIYGFDGTTG